MTRARVSKSSMICSIMSKSPPAEKARPTPVRMIAEVVSSRVDVEPDLRQLGMHHGVGRVQPLRVVHRNAQHAGPRTVKGETLVAVIPI